MDHPISEGDLDAALAEFPHWLAQDVRDWVRKSEQAGWHWFTAAGAVEAAMDDGLKAAS